MALNRKSRERDYEDDDDRPSKSRRRKSRKSSGGSWRWIALILVLAGLYLLPSIVAMTPLLGLAVSSATSGINGKASVGSASLGWMSATTIRNVTLSDMDGNVVATVEELKTSKSLLSLIWNQKDLGVVEITRPTADIVVSPGTSNLEAILFPPDAYETVEEVAAADTPLTLPKMNMTIREGTIQIRETTSTDKWSLDDCALDFNSATTAEGGLAQNFTLQTAVKQAEQTGQLQAQGNLTGSEAVVDVIATNVPLGLVQPIATRFETQLRTQGKLDGKLRLAQTAEGNSISGDMQAIIGGIVWPAVLGTEPVSGGQIAFHGKMLHGAGRLRAEQVAVTTDFGANFVADGDVPISQLTDFTAVPIAASEQAWRLGGTVDLEKLAARLPHLMRLRDDAVIKSGQAVFQLAHDPQQPGLISAVGNVSDVGAIVSGQEVTWRDPLSVNATLAQTPSGLQLQHAAANSSFLVADGTGDANGAQIHATIDLAKLSAELAQFVNLGVDLSGAADGMVQIQRQNANVASLAGSFRGANMRAIRDGVDIWNDAAAEIKFNAMIRDNSVVETGSFSWIAGNDLLMLETAAPIILGGVEPKQLKLQLNGSLGHWQNRLAGLMNLGELRLDGTTAATAGVVMTEQQVTVSGIRASLSNLSVTSQTLNVFEPNLEVEGDLTYGLEDGRIQSPGFTMVGTTISARGKQVNYLPATATHKGSAVGSIAYRLDLNRTMQWKRWGAQPPFLPAGELAGSLNFTQETGGATARIVGEIKNFQLGALSRVAAPQMTQVSMANNVAGGSQYDVVWREPSVGFELNGQIDAADTATIETMQLTTSAVQVAAAGKVEQWSTAPIANLQGNANYDWDLLAPVIASFAGKEVKLTGKQQSPFQIAGPLTAPETQSTAPFAWLSPQLTAAGSIAWQQATLYGVPIGATNIKANLNQGIIGFDPLRIDVSGGKVNAQPRVTLLTNPPLLQLPQGRLVENLAITPEMCQGWMKYAAPLLADSTRAEGRFSLDVQQADFPVLNPMGGEAVGTLTIHGAEVRPGPLAYQYVVLAKQIQAIVKKQIPGQTNPNETVLMRMPEQQVPVQMAGGRVYHQNLTMQIDSVQIISQGSVGVDQSIQMLAKIPVQEAWIQSNPALASLRGKTLEVPISGTLESPKLDARAIEGIAGQAIGGAAQDLIEKGLNRGLDKLFNR
ncbi:hypothetical protein LOC68_15680 [Blastopirellula sp. JC732]|uniref:AsmA-like C-terminal domain-containing protein n=1 Tax=Blastopirellula sediminis TaxID=2894196 RepID=A0A9X1SG50_9BACT|nr:hypothetical protein [Blastopirellula sediminis]MCC9606874.1 hypothetical protein [Blastopirellula sediminis]MCC9629830.1 hypothetical protein [Blastopirellula sediminis]